MKKKSSNVCRECGDPCVNLLKFEDGTRVDGCVKIANSMAQHSFRIKSEEVDSNNEELEFIERWVVDLISGKEHVFEDGDIFEDSGLVSSNTLVVLSKLQALRGVEEDEDEYID